VLEVVCWGGGLAAPPAAASTWLLGSSLGVGASPAAVALAVWSATHAARGLMP
jgi:hypothetical protein